MASDPFLRLHRALRLLQQKNQFIGRAYDTELSLAESHALVELDADPSCSASELAALLNVNPTFLSRLVSGMRKKGLIECIRDTADGRRQRLPITGKGRSILKKMDANANNRMNEFAGHLDDSEQTRLRRYQRQMCDGLAAPPAAARSHDHPLLVEGRRMTRAFRFLSGKVYWTDNLQTDLSVLDWHLLVKISEAATIAPNALAISLGTPRNTISTGLSRLEEKGLITRDVSASDRRSRNVALTTGGRELLNSIEDAAARSLGSALAGMSSADLYDYILLFEKFLGAAASEPVFLLQPRLELRVVSGSEDLLQARRFFVSTLLKGDRLDLLREVCMARANWVCLLYSDDGIKAVLEIGATQKAEAGEFAIINFAADIERDSQERFLQSAISLFEKDNPSATVQTTHELLPGNISLKVSQ
jgi:DNA-binding MarR family transcriptional regulator